GAGVLAESRAVGQQLGGGAGGRGPNLGCVVGAAETARWGELGPGAFLRRDGGLADGGGFATFCAAAGATAPAGAQAGGAAEAAQPLTAAGPDVSPEAAGAKAALRLEAAATLPAGPAVDAAGATHVAAHGTVARRRTLDGIQNLLNDLRVLGPNWDDLEGV